MARKQVRDEVVVLDSAIIKETDFYDCTIVYRGGTVPTLKDNTFNSCRWQLENEALNTAMYFRNLLEGFSDGAGLTLVLEIFLGISPEKEGQSEQ